MRRERLPGTMVQTGPRSQGDMLPGAAPDQEEWECDFDRPPSP